MRIVAAAFLAEAASFSIVAIRKLRRVTAKFPDWKRAIFRCSKEIKGLRGGVVLYAAQENPQIDTVTAEKGRFRMKASTVYTAETVPGGAV